jgi:hypothetical protein
MKSINHMWGPASAGPGLLRLSTVLALIAGGALVSAQTLLPSTPPKGFGASVTPAYEGWFDNADGTHSFLIGYFNRNTKSEIDVPIGTDNHFEPGMPDLGQPTHFLTGRRYGMFVYTMPKEFGKNQKLSWVLTVNGITTSVPFYMSPDYNITPTRASEQGPHGYNLPPVLRFDSQGIAFNGPMANPARSAVARTAVVGVPMVLDLWADDDAQYSSGANTPMIAAASPVELTVSKYRGPGGVVFANSRPKMQTLKGGKPDEPFSGMTSTTVTFDQPGDYLLHVTANDYSGNGGGGAGCCWTTALVTVAVRGENPRTTGGQ